MCCPPHNIHHNSLSWSFPWLTTQRHRSWCRDQAHQGMKKHKGRKHHHGSEQTRPGYHSEHRDTLKERECHLRDYNFGVNTFAILNTNKHSHVSLFIRGVNQAYCRFSTTHGHITDCKLDSLVYAGVCKVIDCGPVLFGPNDLHPTLVIRGFLFVR